MEALEIFALIMLGIGIGFFATLTIALFGRRTNDEEIIERLRENADLEAKSKANQKKPI